MKKAALLSIVSAFANFIVKPCLVRFFAEFQNDSFHCDVLVAIVRKSFQVKWTFGHAMPMVMVMMVMMVIAIVIDRSCTVDKLQPIYIIRSFAPIIESWLFATVSMHSLANKFYYKINILLK